MLSATGLGGPERKHSTEMAYGLVTVPCLALSTCGPTPAGQEAVAAQIGEPFAWVWQVESTGCARWPEGTAWASVSGHRMEAPESVRIRSVSVGKTYDIDVRFVTPQELGGYQGVWQMRGPEGTFFGEKGTVQDWVYSVVP